MPIRTCRMSRGGIPQVLLLFSGLLLILLSAYARAQTGPGNHITIDKGLVNNEVTAIHQDNYGFLWFGTRGGLDRYDGYSFDLIRSNPQSGNNLSNQAVEVLTEANAHTLWIGTKNGGLNSYDLLKDSIVHYHPPKDIQINEIKALAVDSQGLLLIGAIHGFYSFDGKTFHRIAKQQTNAVSCDSQGRVWVGTTTGLYQYLPGEGRLRPMGSHAHVYNITSLAIAEDRGLVYMGTWGAGLLAYHERSDSIQQFLKHPERKDDLDNNNTYRVFLDRNGQLWVGTWGGGLYTFDAARKVFHRVRIKPSTVHNTDYDIVLSIEQDRTGILWIGTDGGGVTKIDPFKKAFLSITHQGETPGLPNTHLLSVFQDPEGGLWLGTRGNGILYSRDYQNFVPKAAGLGGQIIHCFYPSPEGDLWVGTSRGILIFRDYLHRPKARPQLIAFGNGPQDLSGPKVTAIVRDSSQRIWIGTQEHGLNRLLGFAHGKPLFRHYLEKDPGSGGLHNDRISCMLVDHRGQLWLGTYDGLQLYDPVQDRFLWFSHQNRQPNSLSNNTIISMAEDHSGNLWIGTQEGLNRLRYQGPGRLVFTRYYQGPGLPSDYIHSILIDRQGNPWVSTDNGISKLDVKTGRFRNFDVRDGLASNTYSENAGFEAPDGELFFGGIAGLSYFYPDSIRLNTYQPPVYITDVRVNNQAVHVGQTFSHEVLFRRAPFLTRKVRLSYRENIITLSFAALDYHAPNKNQYQYQLVGFDRHWVDAGTQRSATYTNLPSGHYIFRVRATNSDQIWNSRSSDLEIRILPPPWKTWWAYTLYVLLIAALLGFSRYITLSRIRLQNRLQIADLNYRKEHEIAELKSTFFANVSHEFRTPLTLMIGPLEGIAHSDAVPDTLKSILSKVNHQSKRLLSLVNQLLDFNKAENNRLSLQTGQLELVGLLQGLFDSFQEEAARKQIDYRFQCFCETLYVQGDKDKLESIGYNLLSNAFKFTPQGGSIQMSLHQEPGCRQLEWQVSDSGPGISAQDKEKVFDRYYQVAHSEPGTYAGTGIGLAFVKELVELHGGRIRIEDVRPQGSRFCIQLPSLDPPGAVRPESVPEPSSAAAETGTAPQEAEREEAPLILILEDNEELNAYLAETLAPLGQILRAFDGLEGERLAIERMPDLVVSDVMMPGQDGFEVCRRLKTDLRTSHIPVLLLTARADDQSHISGIEQGADSYLSKPFNPAVLVSHAKTLMENRRKLKERYAQKLMLEPTAVEVDSGEEAFLREAVAFVEEHLLDDAVSIDALASRMAMSRSTFYRKLRALTGMSALDFIRMIRLKRAAQLLRSGSYTVSNAAYEAGFSDLKHFRKLFQQQFGTTPSLYARKQDASDPIDLDA